MYRILAFLILLFAKLTINAADNSLIDSKWSDLMNPPHNSSYSSNASSITGFPNLLIGETIYFKVTGSSYRADELQCFLYIEPDTVWIKKRPKKNPELNKHYKLMPYYHGVDSKSYLNPQYTPATEIENIYFIVDSVSAAKVDRSSYTTKYYCDVYLVNTLSNEKLIWRYGSDKSTSDLTLYSETVAEKMIAPNTKVYKKNGSYYSIDKASDFTQYTVEGATYECRLYSIGGNGKLNLKLMSQDGERTDFTYSNNMSYNSPKVINEMEYLSLLESDREYEIDRTLPPVDVEYKFPFDFRFIFGKTNACYVYQKVTKSTSSYYSSSYYKDFISSNKVILIADKKHLHGKDYYIGIYENKGFYIPTSEIELSSENKAKLDTLLSCSDEIRDNYFKFSKRLGHAMYLKKIGTALDELKGFDKYGLSIISWGVYDQSEYTDGTGFRIKFYNPTKKTIKYITINLVGYNAVDDAVSSRGKYTLSPKCVGPIEPDNAGSYDFEYLWFTDLVEYAKIKSIVVQYTNGTSKTIPNISTIEWSEELYNAYFNEELGELKELE